MQITITNQALQCVYIIGNQHKEKTQERIFILDRMFDAIEESVSEFEVQIQSMKEQGEKLDAKSKNTALKVEEREEAKKETLELNKNFEAVHFSCVALDLSNDTIQMMKDILTAAIEGEKVVGRRNIKCVAEALSAIDLANA